MKLAKGCFGMVVILILGIIALGVIGSNAKKKPAVQTTDGPTETRVERPDPPPQNAYVIHMGNRSDMYFQELAPANNSVGLEMKWTYKNTAKVFTKVEAQKTMDQIQRLARMAGGYAPLQMEPCDQ